MNEDQSLGSASPGSATQDEREALEDCVPTCDVIENEIAKFRVRELARPRGVSIKGEPEPDVALANHFDLWLRRIVPSAILARGFRLVGERTENDDQRRAAARGASPLPNGVESLPFGAARTFAMMLQEEGALIRISTRSHGSSAWIEVRAATVLDAARAVLAERAQDAPDCAAPEPGAAAPRMGEPNPSSEIPHV